MDPEAALTEACSLYGYGDVSSAAQKLADYLNWREGGGFEPRLGTVPWFFGAEHHSCCADHTAQWLLICIRRKCAERGIEVCKLTPAVLDRIEDVFGESKEPSICPSCNGSGEGRADGEKCHECGGEGEV